MSRVSGDPSPFEETARNCIDHPPCETGQLGPRDAFFISNALKLTLFYSSVFRDPKEHNAIDNSLNRSI